MFPKSVLETAVHAVTQPASAAIIVTSSAVFPLALIVFLLAPVANAIARL
jgi:hypothetical protein